MPSTTWLARIYRKWKPIAQGRPAWLLFLTGLTILFAGAAVPTRASTQIVATWLPLWFGVFVSLFASSLALGGALAATRREVWTAIATGGLGLVLVTLGLAITATAIWH